MAFDGSTLSALSNLSSITEAELSELSTGTKLTLTGVNAGEITKASDGTYTYTVDPAASVIAIGSAGVAATDGKWVINAATSTQAIMVNVDQGNVVNLTTGTGNDEIDISGAGAGNVINAGGGNNEITLGKETNAAAAAAYATEDGYASEDGIVVNGSTVDGNNVAYQVSGNNIVLTGNGDDTVTNAWRDTVTTGDGADVITSIGQSSINAGNGDDIITVANLDTVTAGSGADVIDIRALAAGQGALLTDYTFGTDRVRVNNLDVQLQTDQLQDNFTTNGRIYHYTANGQRGYLQFANSTDSNFKVTITDGTDPSSDHINVYFAGSTASTLSAVTDTAEGVFMIGNNNNNKDNSNGIGDSILGGSSNDTIVAGFNDTVDGGLGNDSILLYELANNTSASTAVNVIFASSSGKDTVTNFVGGFSDASDYVYLTDGVSNVSGSVSGQDVVLTAGTNSSLTLQGLASRNYWVGGDDMYGLYLKDTNGDVKKAAVISAAGGTFTAGSNPNDIDYYVGSDSKLNAKAVTTKVVVDLGNTGAYTESTAKYAGIVNFKGSDTAENVLIGAASANNTLEGGQGANNTLWGGGSSNDSLIGSTGAVDTFQFGSGNGADSISNFVVSEDVVYAYKGGAVSGTRNSLRSTLTWDDGGVLTLQGTGSDVNTAIKYTVDNATTRSLVLGMTDTANTFNYDANVNIYYGGTVGDTLNVTTDSAKIYLDGRTGQNFTGITTINAYTGTGNYELAGSTASDTILGGTGSSSIWGGAGNVNDTLVGGSGNNTFFFGKGEGNDYVLDSNNEDKVMLYNVAEADIASAALSGENMVIGLKDGSTLTLNHYASQGAGTFELTDATYQYDKDQNVWVKQ